MDKEKVVIFKDVWKCYPLYHHITGGIKTFLLNLPKAISEIRKKKFYALKGISFEINKNETLGIIGHNGAGKSTILSLIAGVIKPTSGYIKVKGKIAPLLELGAGFHPELTGIENIILNSILLGMTKREALKKKDEIIKFADIDEFIDQPIRTYSSGMIARLGFSVAVHTEPDILLIDEILAVGDINFQEKCVHKIREIKKKGITIILVSHSSDLINIFCDRVIKLKNGELIKDEKI